MCFFNNNCCCRCSCGIVGPQGIPGPRGPQGATGATGPQGPQGLSGASLLASFVNASATDIASAGTIPLTDNVNFNTSKITHSSGSATVTLQPGTYLIQYGANSTSATAGLSSLGLQLNGSTIDVASATLTSGTNTANLKGQAVVTVTTASTINLANTGANTTTYNYVDIIVQEVTQ